MEEHLGLAGIRYIQGMIAQYEPKLVEGPEYKIKYHYQGEKNAHGQRYLVRNAFFEPTIRNDIDWVDECLLKIATAFKWNKPAIVGSHRVNYIGFINEQNRDNSLTLLKTLLRLIVKRWPDVEFLTSAELGDLMSEN